MKTPVSSMLLVLLASIIGSFGAVFLKVGSAHLRKGVRHIINIQLAAGVALFLLSSVFFAKGIKNGELSVLYPMVALANVWTLLWSRLFFKEPLTAPKFIALGMILAGITLIGAGDR